MGLFGVLSDVIDAVEDATESAKAVVSETVGKVSEFSKESVKEAKDFLKEEDKKE